MSTFTQGPWYLDQYGHVYGWKTVSEERKTSVVLVDSRHSEATASDKLLIAAAPDLLFALQNLLKVHEGDGGTTYHAGDIARAAIKKATGETA